MSKTIVFLLLIGVLAATLAYEMPPKNNCTIAMCMGDTDDPSWLCCDGYTCDSDNIGICKKDQPAEDGGEPTEGVAETTEGVGEPVEGGDEPAESGDEPAEGDDEPAEDETAAE